MGVTRPAIERLSDIRQRFGKNPNRGRRPEMRTRFSDVDVAEGPTPSASHVRSEEERHVSQYIARLGRRSPATPPRLRLHRRPRRVAMLSVHTSPLHQPGTGDAGEIGRASCRERVSTEV